MAALFGDRDGGWMSPTAATLRGLEDGDGKTAHDQARGFASTLPAGSRAHTWKTCRPSESAVYVCGLRHGTAGRRSRRQVNVAGSLAVKAKEAVALWVTFAGMADSLVAGGMVSLGGGGRVAPGAGAVVNGRPGYPATARSRSPLTPNCHR